MSYHWTEEKGIKSGQDKKVLKILSRKDENVLKILPRKDENVKQKSTFHLKGILDISSSLWLSSQILV